MSRSVNGWFLALYGEYVSDITLWSSDESFIRFPTQWGRLSR
jgi:hypothetical protein